VNAVETIAAAIEKLETLRDESTPKPWHYWTDELNGDVDLWHDQEQRLWIANLGQHENARVYRDAELVVTLHRTIDPILEVLRECLPPSLTLAKLGIDPEGEPWGQQPVLDLARAVLGGDS
jgi:hypothetical protein